MSDHLPPDAMSDLPPRWAVFLTIAALAFVGAGIGIAIIGG